MTTATRKRRTHGELLAEGRKLRFMVTRWFSDETFTRLMAQEAKRIARGDTPTLAEFVRAAGSSIFPCDHCDGSGTYRWGACVNGKMTHGGACFRCGGKGKMNASDCARTREYHNHLRVV